MESTPLLSPQKSSFDYLVAPALWAATAAPRYTICKSPLGSFWNSRGFLAIAATFWCQDHVRELTLIYFGHFGSWIGTWNEAHGVWWILPKNECISEDNEDFTLGKCEMNANVPDHDGWEAKHCWLWARSLELGICIYKILRVYKSIDMD